MPSFICLIAHFLFFRLILALKPPQKWENLAKLKPYLKTKENVNQLRY